MVIRQITTNWPIEEYEVHDSRKWFAVVKNVNKKICELIKMCCTLQEALNILKEKSREII